MARLTVAAAAAASLAMTLPAMAQELPPRPALKSLRYEEDWRVLCDPAQRREPLDALKCVPVAPETTLTLGGEWRERYEVVRNPDFGFDLEQDEVLLHRLLVHADLRAGAGVRGFVQLGAFGYSGREGGAAPTDLNRLDLVQAFLDGSADIGGGRATLRGGRQEIALGSSRLAGVRESPNVRRAFDGVRAIWTTGERRIDAFYFRPVTLAPGVFDDRTDETEAFWGAYATTPLTASLKADFYYLGLSRDEGRFAAGTARERRHSLGARVAGQDAGFDLDWEMVYQFGAFGDGDIRAWTVATDTGFTFAHAPLTPRIGLKVDIASGDRDPGDRVLGTFNALYPRLPYFSEANVIAPANIIDLHPGLELRPAPNLSLAVEWDFLWRQRRRDAVYGTPLLPLPGTANVAGRYIGDQAIFGFEWELRTGLTVAGQYVHFSRGAALREAGGRDVDFLFVSAAYKF